METLLAMGSGVGLSSVAGVRAYLPLALAGIFARLGLFELPAPFDLLSDWLVIGALLALALVESGLDKIPALDSVLDIVQTPIRLVGGAPGGVGRRGHPGARRRRRYSRRGRRAQSRLATVCERGFGGRIGAFLERFRGRGGVGGRDPGHRGTAGVAAPRCLSAVLFLPRQEAAG